MLLNIQNIELNILIRVFCTREYDIQGSKVFVRLLSIINVYLQEEQQFIPLYSNQKFLRSGQIFEKGHKPMNEYFENLIIQNLELVV